MLNTIPNEVARGMIFATGESTSKQPDDAGTNDDEGLEDVVRDEQDYLRSRLRNELGREPTDEELSEWQRQHTEGY
ncbi:MAG: hypothetical protein H0T45_01265 [Pyrinomonadaceae bacterium]|nr:hypothetical protein [Pyrinomonadaceae bacterium]